MTDAPTGSDRGGDGDRDVGPLGPETVERLRSLRVEDIALASLCPAVLFLAAGFEGGIIGVLGVGCWLFAPVTGFVATQFGVLLLAPAWPGIVPAAVLESGVVMLLFAEIVHEHAALRTIGVFGDLAVILCGAVLVAVTADVTPGLVAAGLVTVTAITGYGLHRYERLRLGLIEGSDT